MKIVIRRLLKIFLVTVLIFGISGICNFALSPVTYGHWAEHYRDEYSGRIDTLILGDSFPMYAVQPTVLDDNFGCFSFGECTASQTIKESYYILMDYIETENIKTVYYGLDYYNFLVNDSDNNGIMAQYIAYRRLNSMKIKGLFLKDYVTDENAFEWIFPVMLYRNNFLEIPQNIKNKLTYEYRNYLPLPADSYYYDKGYVYTQQVNEDVIGSFDMKQIDDAQVEWFVKIIEMCKENEIELNVFQTPNKKARIDAIENYGLYYETMKNLAEKYDYRYYDFNFYAERDSLKDDVGFLDAGHLNYTGSTIFMDWFCKVFFAEKSVAETLFKYDF